MKKAIILSGPNGSGKTWISMGIKELFSGEKWQYHSFSRKDNRHPNLSDFDLLIVDECIDLHEIDSYLSLRMLYPNCSFVFCTQAAIETYDHEKYHLISLK